MKYLIIFKDLSIDLLIKKLLFYNLKFVFIINLIIYLTQCKVLLNYLYNFILKLLEPKR